jgi:hypothetical protein
MTWWVNSAQYATGVLALILIVRLISLRNRREPVYVAFAVFLAVQLASTTLVQALTSVDYFISAGVGLRDYRLFYIGTTSILWIFSLAVVYSLAKAVLAELPGIFRFSRRLLNIVFPLAIIIALSTVRSEYWIAGGAKHSEIIGRLVVICYVLDRAISMAGLLVLMAILVFILWFPVKISRNLALLSIGFVVYFGLKTGIELLRTYAPPGTMLYDRLVVLSTSASFVLVFCFVYWIIFIDTKGLKTEVRIGHSWRAAEQARLIGQLEALNLALLRSSEQVKL